MNVRIMQFSSGRGLMHGVTENLYIYEIKSLTAIYRPIVCLYIYRPIIKSFISTDNFASLSSIFLAMSKFIVDEISFRQEKKNVN